MLYESNAAIASKLLRHLTAIIRINNERIAELSTISAVQRIYRELLRLCEPGAGGKDAIISAMPTQQELASKIGATRETVARALGQLINTGVIERRGRTLLIRDHEMLSVMADPDGETVVGGEGRCRGEGIHEDLGKAEFDQCAKGDVGCR